MNKVVINSTHNLLNEALGYRSRVSKEHIDITGEQAKNLEQIRNELANRQFSISDILTFNADKKIRTALLIEAIEKDENSPIHIKEGMARLKSLLYKTSKCDSEDLKKVIEEKIKESNKTKKESQEKEKKLEVKEDEPDIIKELNSDLTEEPNELLNYSDRNEKTAKDKKKKPKGKSSMPRSKTGGTQSKSKYKNSKKLARKIKAEEQKIKWADIEAQRVLAELEARKSEEKLNALTYYEDDTMCEIGNMDVTMNDDVEEIEELVDMTLYDEEFYAAEDEIDEQLYAREEDREEQEQEQEIEIRQIKVLDTGITIELCKKIYSKLLDKEVWEQNNYSRLMTYLRSLMIKITNDLKSYPIGIRGNGFIMSEDKKKCLINTALMDKFGNDIYLIDERANDFDINRKKFQIMSSKIHLLSLGFNRNEVKKLPEPTKFYTKASEIVFSAELDEIDLNDEYHFGHIAVDRKVRLPQNLRGISEYRVAKYIRTSVEEAIKMSKRNYKYVIPMYSLTWGLVQFLIPLRIESDLNEVPELAMVIARKNGFWQVFTVLSLDDAYNNVRLMGPVDSSWLKV